jgi:pyruvate dehydrogenase E1 component beta subunit
MYGRTIPMSMVVRCPSGGNRGYGPTHSQNIQKHLIGIPDLHLYEMSPFHDNTTLLRQMLASARPCVFFEDKVLYTRPMRTAGVVDELFRYDLVPGEPAGRADVAHVVTADAPDPDWLIIAPGGVAERVMSAMRSLLLQEELTCELLVPSRLYPFDIQPLAGLLGRARRVCVVEDGPAGGTWGESLAQMIHSSLWGRLTRPVLLLSAELSIVPTAMHLERQILVQDTKIHQAIAEASR